ncbi:MAG: sigma-54 dependent transcriptional regulator [Desulforhopalus sp.]
MQDNDSAILIIDNDPRVFDILLKCKDKLNVPFSYAPTLQEGLEKYRSSNHQIVLMRDSLTDGYACYAIQDFCNETQSPEIIIYSTNGNPEHVEVALKSGAWDYIIGPSPEHFLPDLVHRALRYRQSKKDIEPLTKNEIRDQLKHHGIIGHSLAIQKCINFAAKVAQSDSNVLITGETGTGKELFAAVIHNLSNRASKHLTIVDCAALPSTLVESILFGHAKGSFTGADRAQAGIIKQSDGGTLFLDEVAEMPTEIQKKFLRVIQERKYLPVGSGVETKSDFRLIAATNKDLYAMVKEGTFREDLLFRLKTFHLELPPLRMRSTDIAELVYHYRDLYCKRNKLKKKKLSSDYIMFLSQYDWPGNVRELFQAIECSIASAQDSTILYSKHLPLNIRIQIAKNKIKGTDVHEPEVDEPDSAPPDLHDMPTIKGDRDRVIANQEKKYLTQLLALSKGNIRKCCETSGLSRSRLYDLLKKYQLSHK